VRFELAKCLSPANPMVVILQSTVDAWSNNLCLLNHLCFLIETREVFQILKWLQEKKLQSIFGIFSSHYCLFQACIASHFGLVIQSYKPTYIKNCFYVVNGHVFAFLTTLDWLFKFQGEYIKMLAMCLLYSYYECMRSFALRCTWSLQFYA
jgi:hypothetical protein